jgi:threonine synthase
MIRYISTRGGVAPQSFSDVLLSGMAADGGLFVPETVPYLREEIEGWRGLPYDELAFRIMKPFIGGDIKDEILKDILREVYNPKIFTDERIAPVISFAGDEGQPIYMLELFHGPTLSFKDYALQLLGRLFDEILYKRKQNLTIIGATSGDTGSAAIEGCRHCKYIDLTILHPYERTSEFQRRQMTSVIAPHIHNYAVKGTFDDCQNMVKDSFANEDFRNEVNLSAINSINWARVMAQIVYYFHAYYQMTYFGETIYVAVPTGNFGNIYAAYIARKMGLPIEALIVATNENDILTRFFDTGIMAQNGVVPTISPSMDIEISSNFERYLYDLLDGDSEELKRLMTSLKTKKSMHVDQALMEKAQKLFFAGRVDDTQTKETMAKVFADTGIILDPHTAVGVTVAQRLRNEGSLIKHKKILTLACAHPAKFEDAVVAAIGKPSPVPKSMSALWERPEKYEVIEADSALLQEKVRANLSS